MNDPEKPELPVPGQILLAPVEQDPSVGQSILQNDRQFEAWGFVSLAAAQLSDVAGAAAAISENLVVDYGQQALLYNEKTHVDLAMPFGITVVLGKGPLNEDGFVDFSYGKHKRVGQHSDRFFVAFHENPSDKLTAWLTKRIPQLLHRLEKQAQRRKPDYVAFYLSWWCKEDSAPIGLLNKMLSARTKDPKHQKPGRIAIPNLYKGLRPT